VTSKPVLVDTSAWILALKKQPNAIARNRVQELLIDSKVAIVLIISLELLGGVKSEKEFRRLKSRLAALYQIPLGKSEWEEAARIAFELRRKGITIPYIDIIICAVALIHDLILLHADRHFDLMAEETSLKVESLLT
jgi:predicted nucleic acid-binding protein